MNKQRSRVVLPLEAAGALCCFGGGILAAIFGCLLTSTTWLLSVELHPWLRGTGTALLITAIPLLILAGHFMDCMEKN